MGTSAQRRALYPSITAFAAADPAVAEALLIFEVPAGREPLLSGRAVKQLANRIRMARMTRRLVYQVEHNPSQVGTGLHGAGNRQRWCRTDHCVGGCPALLIGVLCAGDGQFRPGHKLCVCSLGAAPEDAPVDPAPRK